MCALLSFIGAKRRKLNAPEALLLIYIFSYSFSIALSVVRAEDFERIVASTYNLSYWIMGAMILSAGYSWNIERLRRPASYVILFMIAVAIAGFAFGGGGDVSFRSALGSLFARTPLPTLLEDSLSVSIFGYDYL